MRRPAERTTRSPAVIGISLFSLLMAATVLMVSLRAWHRLETYHSPALGVPMQSKPAPRLSSRTALIIVEGLSADDVQRMPSLRWLAVSGGTWQIRMPDAWWAPASWATLLTGANPVDHSRFVPGQQGPLVADQLLAAASRNGKMTRVVTDPAFGDLVTGWSQPAQLAELPKLVQPGGPPLVLAHLSANDETTLRSIDRLVAEMVATMDLGQSSLAVVGLGKPYRHPGLPPASPVLVAAGVTLLPGVNSTCDLRDVTMTIADLAGLPIPALANGRSLVREPNPPAEATPTTAKPTTQPLLQRVQSWWAALPPGMPDRVKSIAFPAGLLLLILLAILWQPVRWAALGQTWRWALLMPPVFWLLAGQWPWQVLGPIHERFGAAWVWQLAMPMSLASVLVGIWGGLRLGGRRKIAWVRSSLVLGTWSTSALLVLAATALAWLYGSNFAVALPPTPVLWAYFALLWAAVGVLTVVPVALPLALMAAGWAAHRGELTRSRAEKQVAITSRPGTSGARQPASDESAERHNVIDLSTHRRPPSE